MKVVHIAFQYGFANTGGAAIASTRLHQALLAYGVESHYICVHQREPGTNVHELPQGWRRGLFFALTKIARCLWKFTPYRRSICLNVVPLFGLKKMLARIKPDIVHVQWINSDVCSFEQLAKLPYKTVFGLHDLFMVNAIRPYPREDRRFIEGFGPENSTRIERWLFGRKARLVGRTEPSFIGPSQWVCNECRRSIIGRAAKAIAIPNIIDERYLDAEMRREVSTSRRLVILFGAYGGRRNPDKGFDDLARALELLPADVRARCELRVFGEDAEACETGGVRTVFLGCVTDPVRLRQVYCAADVFAFPSAQETQGMTKVEAMSCGLPVVAFDRTACAEGIEHLRTGWIAPDGDCSAFAEGILHYYREWENGALSARRDLIAMRAREQFSTSALVGRILDAYKMV